MSHRKFNWVVFGVLFLVLGQGVFADEGAGETPVDEAVASEPMEPSPFAAQSNQPDGSSSETVKVPPPEISREEAGGSLLGPVSLGPHLTLIGFPTPFRFGLNMEYLDWASVGFDYGLLPSITISNVSVKQNSWRLGAKVFPFKGAFFVGLSMGKQKFTGSLVQNTAGTTVTYGLEVDTTILVPMVGWRWLWDSGFFMVMELGAQFASSNTASFSSNAPAAIQATAEYATYKADIEKQGRDFGQSTLPHVALIQFGWLF